MAEVQYHPLRKKAINPNRARWYSLGLVAGGVLFAFLTIRTNYNYFEQYYTEWDFWVRVLVFAIGIEGAIILWPLFHGFGNKWQGRFIWVFELALVAVALTHTLLVSDVSITKKQASKTKEEARVDYDRTQAEADRISKENQKIQANYERQQSNHNAQMRFWRDAAYVARREGRQAPPSPPAPQQPQFLPIPQVNQDLATNASLSVELAGQARASHQLLQGLMFGMVGIVITGLMTMVYLADGSRVKAWLLRKRASAISKGIKNQDDSSSDLRELGAHEAPRQPDAAPLPLPDGVISAPTPPARAAAREPVAPPGFNGKPLGKV